MLRVPSEERPTIIPLRVVGVVALPLLTLLPRELSLDETLASVAGFVGFLYQISGRATEERNPLRGETKGGSTSNSASSSSSSISASEPPTEKSSMSLAILSGVSGVAKFASASAASK